MIFDSAKEFLAKQHLSPLLSTVNQQLVSLNKWDSVGKALQASFVGVAQPSQNHRDAARSPRQPMPITAITARGIGCRQGLRNRCGITESWVCQQQQISSSRKDTVAHWQQHLCLSPELTASLPDSFSLPPCLSLYLAACVSPCLNTQVLGTTNVLSAPVLDEDGE